MLRVVFAAALVQDAALLVLQPQGVNGRQVGIADVLHQPDGPEFLDALAVLEVNDLQSAFCATGPAGFPYFSKAAAAEELG